MSKSPAPYLNNTPVPALPDGDYVKYCTGHLAHFGDSFSLRFQPVPGYRFLNYSDDSGRIYCDGSELVFPAAGARLFARSGPAPRPSAGDIVYVASGEPLGAFVVVDFDAESDAMLASLGKIRESIYDATLWKIHPTSELVFVGRWSPPADRQADFELDRLVRGEGVFEFDRVVADSLRQSRTFNFPFSES